jgi:hypothetical protein
MATLPAKSKSVVMMGLLAVPAAICQLDLQERCAQTGLLLQ